MDRNRAFEAELAINLGLTMGSDTFAVTGGAVRSLEVELKPWGFEAALSFLVARGEDGDELFVPFSSGALTWATVGFRTTRRRPEGEEADLFELRGVVVDRWVEETIGHGLSGKPVVRRLYGIRLVDAASALWTLHHPCELHTEVTPKQIIERHVPEGLTLEFDHRPLEAEQRMLFLGLLAPPDGEASFYDWVVWLLDRSGGHLGYDYRQKRHRLATLHARDPSPAELSFKDVEPRLLFPEPPRASGRVHNGSTLQAGVQDVTQPFSTTGVRRDRLLVTALPKDVERAKARMGERLRREPEGAELVLRRFPQDALYPGRVLKLEGFGQPARVTGKAYRVVELRIEGHATTLREDEPDTEGTLKELTVRLEARASARLELVDGSVPRLPPHRVPAYPHRVEGKIVGAGKPEERTWVTREDPDTSLRFQTVDVPLWNKKILVPFEPNGDTGHFFFPAFQETRVMVELELDSASIERFLDWPAGAVGTEESQSNRLLLGKKAADETLLEHRFTDGKPELTLLRTRGPDKQTMEISEGLLRIVVEEETTGGLSQPTYDLTVQVEGAKGQVTMRVKGALQEVTGRFQGASGAVVGQLEGSIESLSGALGQMEGQLGARIEAAQTELEAAAGAMTAALGEVITAISSAKSELMAAIGR